MKRCFLLRTLIVVPACIIALTWLPGCKKFLAVSPPDTLIVSAKVFANEQLANDAVSGLYAETMRIFDFMNGYMTRFPGQYADELTRTSPGSSDMPFLQNSLTPTD